MQAELANSMKNNKDIDIDIRDRFLDLVYSHPTVLFWSVIVKF